MHWKEATFSSWKTTRARSLLLLLLTISRLLLTRRGTGSMRLKTMKSWCCILWWLIHTQLTAATGRLLSRFMKTTRGSLLPVICGWTPMPIIRTPGRCTRSWATRKSESFLVNSTGLRMSHWSFWKRSCKRSISSDWDITWKWVSNNSVEEGNIEINKELKQKLDELVAQERTK